MASITIELEFMDSEELQSLISFGWTSTGVTPEDFKKLVRGLIILQGAEDTIQWMGKVFGQDGRDCAQNFSDELDREKMLEQQEQIRKRAAFAWRD